GIFCRVSELLLLLGGCLLGGLPDLLGLVLPRSCFVLGLHLLSDLLGGLSGLFLGLRPLLVRGGELLFGRVLVRVLLRVLSGFLARLLYVPTGLFLDLLLYDGPLANRLGNSLGDLDLTALILLRGPVVGAFWSVRNRLLVLR